MRLKQYKNQYFTWFSGRFQQFDFGPIKNLLLYKNTTAPDYPLGKISAPVVLYYSLNDDFTTESVSNWILKVACVLLKDVFLKYIYTLFYYTQDVSEVHAKLPNAVTRRIACPRFTHIDFLFQSRAKSLVYDDVLQTLKNYSSQEINAVRKRDAKVYRVNRV